MKHEPTERRSQPDPAPTTRHDPKECPHEGFRVEAGVNRLLDTGRFIADVRIHCVQCDEAFRFMGVAQAGLRFDVPTVSIDETELHVPIEPEGEKRLRESAGFQMPQIPQRH